MPLIPAPNSSSSGTSLVKRGAACGELGVGKNQFAAQLNYVPLPEWMQIESRNALTKAQVGWRGAARWSRIRTRPSRVADVVDRDRGSRGALSGRNAMKAIVHTRYGPPCLLQLQDVKTPAPKDHKRPDRRACRFAQSWGLAHCAR